MAEPHLGTAIVQAEELQDRLVRVAYGLHFSCENIATLMEQRGESRRVSATDYPTEAKRWHEAAGQALDLVRVWGRSHVPSLPAECPTRTADLGREQAAAAALADPVMNALYAATLRVDSLMSEADDRLQGRLNELAQLLETTVRRIRDVVLDLTADR